MNLFKFFSFSSLTHNERRQADAALCGRSMVEMLGVLAIIGVLSVGAISGYSKAMMKYKLNKFSESINTLLNYALQYLPQFESSIGQTFYNEILYKLNIIPDGITYDTVSKIMYDIFDDKITVYRNHTEDNIKANILSISADTSDMSKQICRTALTVAKENAFALYSVSVKDDNDGDDGMFSTRLWGDNYCTSSVKCLRNMTVADAENVCDFCNDIEKRCRIMITWIQ